MSVSTSERACGTRRLTHITVGSIKPRVSSTAPMVNIAENRNAVENCGSANAVVSPEIVHRSKKLLAPSSTVGTRWNANRAMA